MLFRGLTFDLPEMAAQNALAKVSGHLLEVREIQ